MNEVIIHAGRLGETELLERKIDVNTRASKGYTPLIIACYNNHYDAAKLLLERGADLNLQHGNGEQYSCLDLTIFLNYYWKRS